ncbi:tautomerase family protein [Pseudonocardia kongjuensis]|uniref:Tautomerase family protein n=1 Tax=Pseudonocardia kongjuensis TaxID=102227 RepID=A0ABN1XS47_9PSEU
MPVIDVSLLAGRPPEVLHALQVALHDAAVAALDVPPGSVRVLLREVPPTHWTVGGVTVAQRRAGQD